MAGDLRAGRQSTRAAKRKSTPTDDDVGNATYDVDTGVNGAPMGRRLPVPAGLVVLKRAL